MRVSFGGALCMLAVLVLLAASMPVAGQVRDSGAAAGAVSEDSQLQTLSMEVVRSSTEQAVRCRVPRVRIPRSAGCLTTSAYPHCKWRMPSPVRHGMFRKWRNTTPEHWWGRPALVTVILAAAADYHLNYPSERLVVGDLDAPGPRHRTHNHGVDVDLYLPHMMETENLHGGDYRENYADLSDAQVDERREHLARLAHSLATCTSGNVRIYYNDPVVRHDFRSWFDAHGLVSSFGEPMQEHNELHRFHFHVSIRPGQRVLPFEAN